MTNPSKNNASHPHKKSFTSYNERKARCDTRECNTKAMETEKSYNEPLKLNLNALFRLIKRRMLMCGNTERDGKAFHNDAKRKRWRQNQKKIQMLFLCNGRRKMWRNVSWVIKRLLKPIVWKNRLKRNWNVYSKWEKLT